MNLKHLSDKMGLDENEYIDLLYLFIDTATADLVNLKTAVSNEYMNKAAGIAHSLKGAALNMGLTDFFETAATIEAEIHRGPRADVGQLIHRLTELLADLTRMV
ncbi:MAG: Hpt domain-containing protein [Desulfobacterales bacterium]|nr:Hpt domain-containing protein [Desulfobacterales bacterium]